MGDKLVSLHPSCLSSLQPFSVKRVCNKEEQTGEISSRSISLSTLTFFPSSQPLEHVSIDRALRNPIDQRTKAPFHLCKHPLNPSSCVRYQKPFNISAASKGWQQLLLVFCCALVTNLSLASKREADLYESILEKHEALVRPVENPDDPIVVKMGVILQQLIDVDEKNQVADLNAYLRMEWTDYSVQWDPNEYEGISDLRFRKEQLWTPDVLLYNSADPQYDRSYASNLVVYHTGLVNWMPPGVFRLTCQINIVYFPFDVQTCWMKFGSWTFDGTKLDLQVDDNGFDISSFIPNGEWKLENTSVTRNVQSYECCPEPYYDLVFTFTIRRLALYYAFNLILPCVLITLLTLVGFTLPPDAGEKMSLQITIMLSICVFQNQIAEMSPPTSEAVPFLGLFFAMCMFTCAGSVVGTALVLNFHHRNRRTHKMSMTMKLIMMNWLPWLLLMKRPGCIATKRQLIRKKKQVKERLDICLAALLEDVPAPDEDEVLSMDVESIKTTPAMLAQLLVLQQIYKELNIMNQKVEKAEIEKASEDDWKFCAMVLDRLCLYLLSFFITFSSLILFGIVPDIASSF